MSNVFLSPDPNLWESFGDKLHRQFSRRSNWRVVLRESGLPQDVQGVIQSVVDRSRLMRFEKGEVAEELIAHFEDGNRSGNSYRSLIASFGEPEVVAELIHSSKVRSRPMLMKLVRGGMWGGAGMLGIYLTMMFYIYSASPNPTVDYLALFNQTIEETPDELRAWPIYRDVWDKFGFSEGGDGKFVEIYHPLSEKYTQDRRLVRPGDPSWDVAVQKIKDSEELMDAFRKGSRLPFLGVSLQVNPNNYSERDFRALFPNQEYGDNRNGWGVEGLSDEAEELLDDALVGILLPHVQSFRKAARIFHVDTRLAVEEGDSERVVDNIEVTFGLAEQVRDQSCLVNSLVAIAITNIGFQQIEEVMIEHPDFLSNQQLERIQSVVQELPVRQHVDFSGERIFQKDMVQRAFTDDGNGDGRLTPQGLELFDAMMGLSTQIDAGGEWYRPMLQKAILSPVSLIQAAGRKETVERLDMLMDQVEMRFDSPRWLDDLSDLDELVADDAERFVMISQLFPAFQNVKSAVSRTLGLQDAVSLAVTLELYRRETGQWPDSIEEVGPEWIEELPVDRVNGEPVKVVFSPQGPKIYSVGGDHDDDGGVGILMAEWNQDLAQDGDWVMWPQDKHEAVEQ